MIRAVFPSEASTRICTVASSPRAILRPYSPGMINAPRALLEAKASSGCLSVGHEATWKLNDWRKASTNFWDACDWSRSCTMMGRSFTVSEIAVVCNNNKITGSRSANATARRSRRSCVNSFWACAKIRRMFAPLLFSADLAVLASLLDNADEHIFEREAPFARLEYTNSPRFEPLRVLANAGIDFAIRDDVKPLAKQRN